jgi:hypothetical protein
LLRRLLRQALAAGLQSQSVLLQRLLCETATVHCERPAVLLRRLLLQATSARLLPAPDQFKVPLSIGTASWNKGSSRFDLKGLAGTVESIRRREPFGIHMVPQGFFIWKWYALPTVNRLAIVTVGSSGLSASH